MLQDDIRFYTDALRARGEAIGNGVSNSMVNRVVRWGTGGGATTVAMQNAAANAAGTASVLSTTSALGLGLIGAAASTAVRLYFNQQDHERQEKRLTSIYRREIGAVLGKEPDTVDVTDLHLAAQHNPGLQDAITRNNQIRNSQTIVWGAATVATYALAYLAVGALLGAAATGAAAIIGAAVVGAAGFKAFQSIGSRIANNVLKLDEPTVAEEVHALERAQNRGRALSQEQVMEVFAAASPKLAQMITEKYGQPFADLGQAQRRDATLALGDYFNVAALTDEINAGTKSARELLFSAYGQQSGAEMDKTTAMQVREAAQARVQQLRGGIDALRHAATDRFNTMRGQQPETPAEVASATMTPQQQASWQERVADEQAGPGQGFREREQLRAAQRAAQTGSLGVA